MLRLLQEATRLKQREADKDNGQAADDLAISILGFQDEKTSTPDKTGRQQSADAEMAEYRLTESNRHFASMKTAIVSAIAIAIGPQPRRPPSLDGKGRSGRKRATGHPGDAECWRA